jgi:Ral GTPase-activating protein subunit alpha
MYTYTQKRHVGNDIVHIVWNEHGRPYRPATITSQFNDVHIIIDPLPTNLYQVRIVAKEEVPSFGPLRTGMVVSMDLLPQLVRQTAIAANHAVRSTADAYKRPFTVRASCIKAINSRYMNHKQFEEFVGELYQPLKESSIVEATAAASYGNTPREHEATLSSSLSSSSTGASVTSSVTAAGKGGEVDSSIPAAAAVPSEVSSVSASSSSGTAD